MKILSVNIGLPKEVAWRGRRILTGIFKDPVKGRVHVDGVNLVGDRQADPSVHGGTEKAVYAYPSEHYRYWRAQYPGRDLGWGYFGENLTTEGLVESTVRIGDRYRVGTAELIVTQPRLPCYKLGIRFGDSDIIKRFQATGRTGFYFAVARRGDVEAQDEMRLLEQDPRDFSIAVASALYISEDPDREMLERAANHPFLPEGWRNHFARRLGCQDSPPNLRTKLGKIGSRQGGKPI